MICSPSLLHIDLCGFLCTKLAKSVVTRYTRYSKHIIWGGGGDFCPESRDNRNGSAFARNTFLFSAIETFKETGFKRNEGKRFFSFSGKYEGAEERVRFLKRVF